MPALPFYIAYVPSDHNETNPKMEKAENPCPARLFGKRKSSIVSDMSLAEAAIFEYAFKLGMQIAIETLTE